MSAFVIEAVALSIVIVLSLCFNALVIIAFCKYFDTTKSKDIFLVSLAVSDLLQAIIGYPPEVKSMLIGTQGVDFIVCKAVGFFVTFLGLVSINHIAYLALERLIAVAFPYTISKMQTKQFIVISLSVIWLLGLSWAVFPLLGWSDYVEESDGIRCSIAWQDLSPSGRSYIYALVVFEYVIPVSIMATSFAVVRKVAKGMNERQRQISGSQHSEDAMKKHDKMIVVMASSYLIAWTPYAVISIYGTITGNKISATLGTAFAITAKSSTMFNPMIYALLYNDFRGKVKRLFGRRVTPVM
ncbi:rhodopsin, G0-coupled-like [Hydractinia symbiolongicarpus]|uniref:rhodopsin, G0-coupled-like n=1 Tax=Hydractinia symbiolongicarpus TaxID=13093 RepID=UPI002550718F|nr:rhodopsin, G0-coupled-like [Hydractinia symbiolongicarpus]